MHRRLVLPREAVFHHGKEMEEVRLRSQHPIATPNEFTSRGADAEGRLCST